MWPYYMEQFQIYNYGKQNKFKEGGGGEKETPYIPASALYITETQFGLILIFVSIHRSCNFEHVQSTSNVVL